MKIFEDYEPGTIELLAAELEVLRNEDIIKWNLEMRSRTALQAYWFRDDKAVRFDCQACGQQYIVNHHLLRVIHLEPSDHVVVVAREHPTWAPDTVHLGHYF